MSQSLKVPRGVAIRAVAAAQLYASRLDGQTADDRKEDEVSARKAPADKIASTTKPRRQD
ncbi:MAG: hypothetical protein ACKVS5_05290 [Parvularculaceae bacterium]